MQFLAAQAYHGERDGRCGHGQRAQEGGVAVAPEMERQVVGYKKGCERPEQGDAPTALDAFDKIGGIFFKPQREHDDDDPNTGEILDKHPGLLR